MCVVLLACVCMSVYVVCVMYVEHGMYAGVYVLVCVCCISYVSYLGYLGGLSSIR